MDLHTVDGLLLATGFTGALTFVFLCRAIYHRFAPPLSVSVWFSPKGGCTEAITGHIRQARQEVLVQAFSFTSKAIAEAIVAAKTRGLQVDIILDRSNEDEPDSAWKELLGDGLTPLIDGEHGHAHNKVIILDGQTIITGSFNFTQQAEHDNAENLVIISGHAELARSFRQNFLEHKAHSRPAKRKAITLPPPPAERKAA